jgi:hypothetical protein
VLVKRVRTAVNFIKFLLVHCLIQRIHFSKNIMKVNGLKETDQWLGQISHLLEPIRFLSVGLHEVAKCTMEVNQKEDNT